MSPLKMGSGAGRSSGGGSGRRRRPPPAFSNGINCAKGHASNEECKNYGTRPEPSFGDHFSMSKRISKSLYFAQKLPSTPRPSLPLTVLAVKSFTTQVLGNADTLEFLDLEMASEIGRNACVSPTALIMALVYLERLSTQNPNYLSSVKPSELFVVSLLVASKFIQDDGEDSGIYNDEWATSSKIDLKQLNKLELQFLDAINWSVSVTRDEFDKVLTVVEQKLALNQGIRRGWFTYAEIGTLSDIAFTWSTVAPILQNYLLQVVTLACMTYSALIATVLSSTFYPKIFAFTKTILLSSILHASTSTNMLSSSQSIELCTGFNKTNNHLNPISKLNHPQDSTPTEKIEAELMSLENILDEDTSESDLTKLLNLDGRFVSLLPSHQKRGYDKKISPYGYGDGDYNYNRNFETAPSQNYGSGIRNIINNPSDDTTLGNSAISKMMENWTESRRSNIGKLWSSFCCNNDAYQFLDTSTHDKGNSLRFSSYMLIKV